MTSLYDVDGPLPDTMEQIQQVTESQEAVMSFFYTDQDNQVMVTISQAWDYSFLSGSQ